MVVGSREPRVYLRQWSNGLCHSQEVNFSTQLDCRLLEYRNLTIIQLLQPCLLQVEQNYIFMVFLFSRCEYSSIFISSDWNFSLTFHYLVSSGPSNSHLHPWEHNTGCQHVRGPSSPHFQPIYHPHCGHRPTELATGDNKSNLLKAWQIN